MVYPDMVHHFPAENEINVSRAASTHHVVVLHRQGQHKIEILALSIVSTYSFLVALELSPNQVRRRMVPQISLPGNMT